MITETDEHIIESAEEDAHLEEQLRNAARRLKREYSLYAGGYTYSSSIYFKFSICKNRTHRRVLPFYDDTSNELYVHIFFDERWFGPGEQFDVTDIDKLVLYFKFKLKDTLENMKEKLPGYRLYFPDDSINK